MIGCVDVNRAAKQRNRAMMTSIRSILIKSCMTNIQREMTQLEHWLQHLPEEGNGTIPFPSSQPTVDLSSLSHAIENLSKQMTHQQHTLSNIMDRLSVLETLRQIHIDSPTQEMEDPWIDNHCVPLSNEIVGEDCLSEPLYTFNKELPACCGESVSPVESVPHVESVSPVESVPHVESGTTASPIVTVTTAPAQEPTQPSETVQEVVEVVEEEVVEEEEKEEVVEEEEEVVEEEVVEEEEEEEELEEIEYLHKKYYRNNEGFIYTIDEDEQPSENPVGYWKEKTQTIAFYKTK